MAVIVGQGISVSPVPDAKLSHESTGTVQNKAVADAIAAEYSTSKTYSVGDVCTHDGKLYECIVDIPTAEGWTSAHWKVSNLGDVASDLNRQLSDLEDTVSTTQIINTASGAIASFSDGADGQPIRKLVAQIEPVQDLHGQDSPYPAGGGKNKCDGIAYDGAISSNIPRIFNKTPVTSPHNISSGFGGVCFFAKVESGNTYALSSDETGNAQTFYWAIYSSLDDALNIANALQSGATNVSFTAEHDGYVLFMRYNSTSGTSITWTYAQTEVGSTATTFAPYSNECPISGWTEAEIEQRGKNLCDDTLISNITYNASGVIVQSPNYATTAKTRIKNNTTYTYYHNLQTQSLHYVNFFDENGAFLTQASIRGNDNTVTFTTPDNAYYVAVTASRQQEINISEFIPAQLELGSTATAYEPYTGNQISVTFPDTIYGGEDEFISGKLKSTMGKIVFDGTQSILATNWQPKENSVAWCYYYDLTNHVFPTILADVPTFLASSCPVVSAGEAIIGYNPQLLEVSCYNTSGIGVIFRTTDMTLTTASAINAYLAENPVTLVYELATPTTFTHDPQQIDTLYGANNIWADTGDVTVTAPKDTKLYIDGKLAEIQATILENIGG